MVEMKCKEYILKELAIHMIGYFELWLGQFESNNCRNWILSIDNMSGHVLELISVGKMHFYPLLQTDKTRILREYEPKETLLN